MLPILQEVSRGWLFVFGIAIGMTIMSTALFFTVYGGTDFLCQQDYERCLDNPLADCVYTCDTTEIDIASLGRLVLAPLPILLLTFVLFLLRRDAKRSM